MCSTLRLLCHHSWGLQGHCMLSLEVNKYITLFGGRFTPGCYMYMYLDSNGTSSKAFAAI